MDDPYWTVTLDPWYEDDGGTRSSRLYLGATREDAVEGMSGFEPCVPTDGADAKMRPSDDRPATVRAPDVGRTLGR